MEALWVYGLCFAGGSKWKGVFGWLVVLAADGLVVYEVAVGAGMVFGLVCDCWPSDASSDVAKAW